MRVSQTRKLRNNSALKAPKSSNRFLCVCSWLAAKGSVFADGFLHPLASGFLASEPAGERFEVPANVKNYPTVGA